VREIVGLLVFALAGSTVGVAGLRRAKWPENSPRLGIIAWQTLTGSAFIALLLAGLSISVPMTGFGGSLSDLLHACVVALRAQYATPGGAALHAVGAVGFASLALRASYMVARGLLGARKTRREHLSQLRLGARHEEDLGVFVLDHPVAAVYCMPGRAGTIVLTSAALAALDETEIAAVLAHERAHLRGHHHLVLAGAVALARTMPFLPGLRTAQTQQARLLEMIADDNAASHGARITVARALVHLAEGSVPTPALGAADVAAAARVHRMLGPKHRMGFGRRTLIAGAILLTAATPLVLAAGPAVVAWQKDSCPLEIPVRA